MRCLPSLDHIEVTLQVVGLQLAEHTAIDVAREDSIEVADCLIERTKPALRSTTLDQSSRHDLVVEHAIALVFLAFDCLNLLDNITAVIDSGHVASKLDETSGAIETSHEEFWILLQCLGVGIDGCVIIEARKEVVTLVLEPDRVSIFHIDIHFLLLLIGHILALRIGRLFQLTFSCWQMRKLLPCEASRDGLLLTDLGHLSLRLLVNHVRRRVLVVDILIIVDLVGLGLIL